MASVPRGNSEGTARLTAREGNRRADRRLDLFHKTAGSINGDG